MTDPYRIALALVRLYGAINLYSAAFLLVTCILGMAAVRASGVTELMGYVLSLGLYLVMYLVSGVAMWICSKPIARFAAKAFAA